MSIYKSGSLIDNRYEVVQGPHENEGLKGGMGIVYLCVDHDEKQRPVALKTFQPQFLSKHEIRDRFLREGTTWVDLGSHPHIVRAYSVKYIEHRLEIYLVLELVAATEGKRDASLYSLLTDEPLRLEQSLLFALHIARGMKHATIKIPNLVHRDLKPSNILVGRDGFARVTDFGLARAMVGAAEQATGIKKSDSLASIQGAEGEQSSKLGENEEESSTKPRTQLTIEGGIVGTPPYVPPEQWLGEELDARSDIYAFGCILQEMVTGQRAAQGKTWRKLKQVHLTGELRPLPDNTPTEVCTLIQTCLTLDKEERYSNWSEVESAVGTAYFNITGQQPPAELTPAEVTHADRIATGWSYNAMGASYIDISKYNTAISYFERVTQIGRAEGERLLEACGLGNLGIVYDDLGAPQRAIGYYEQQLTITRQIGNRAGEGAALNLLGVAYKNLGEYKRAIGYYKQSLTIAHQIGNRAGEGTTLNNLGITYRYLGKYKRAIGYYEQSLAIARQMSNRAQEENALGNLGNTYQDLGDPQRAISYHEQDLAIARQIGNLAGEGVALGNLGVAHLLLGDPQRAIGYYEQALVIARQIGSRAGVERALGNLGNAYRDLGHPQRAIGYYEQALTIARQIEDRAGEGTALANLGKAHYMLGNPQQAIDYLNQALAIAQKIGNVMSIARYSMSIASLLTLQGYLSKAQPHAEIAAQLFAQVGHPQRAQRAQQVVAYIRRAG